MFIRASQEWLEQFENVRFEGLQGANAQKTLLVVAVMAAHALGEGSGVGVSFCGHRGWVQVLNPDPQHCFSLGRHPAHRLAVTSDVVKQTTAVRQLSRRSCAGCSFQARGIVSQV